MKIKAIDKIVSNERGFSFVEIIIVILILAIMVVFSVIAFGGKDLYYADHQAYLLADAIKEARQRAITQQETIRLEVSQTKREIRLINENTAGNAADDEIIKRISLASRKNLIFDAVPTNISSNPSEPTPVPTAVFKTSLHPLSASENIATLRFLRNGNVVNDGSNDVGDNSVMTGATFYFWKPIITNGTITNKGSVIRAITILGNSGNSNYWGCEVKNNQCTNWKK